MSKPKQLPLNSHAGYVVYGGDGLKRQAFGVVSEDYECNATGPSMPKSISEVLIPIEDRRFFDHKGIDARAVLRATVQNIKGLKISQGGSSLTQQLARSILRDNRRTIHRKLRETINAVLLERKHTKQEILDLYFNNVYFGRNLRGFRTAGLYYFGKEIADLSQPEIVNLVTILRGPNLYVGSPELTKARMVLLSNILRDAGVISRGDHKNNLESPPKLGSHKLQIIKQAPIKFISTSVDHTLRSIESTVDLNLQNLCSEWIADSKYPESVIIVSKLGVISFASSFGSSYPFLSKANVGSTLKPFLYCAIREAGVGTDETFESYRNTLNWDVREVEQVKPRLTLGECLLHSNNNGFINAASKIGLNEALHYLGKVILKDQSRMTFSSLLGSTIDGVSLFELASAYSRFFTESELNPIKIECLGILSRNFENKLGIKVENMFLKTGTTNDNKERYAVIHTPESTLAFLRNCNPENEQTKEGQFVFRILGFMKGYLNRRKDYTWSL